MDPSVKGEGMIRTAADLESVCDSARDEGILSLDTEFMWRSTYRPQLGLVQGGTRSVCGAVDCLAGFSPASLGAALADPSIVKILHDARQDLTHLRHYTGGTPVNVFDTQLAAAFAGFQGGIGLQKLLFEAIDVGLPKTETCTDWSRRPLTDAQVRYALDDVRYLVALRAALLAQCDAFGTREWLEEDLQRLELPEAYGEIEHEEAWKRIKNASRHLRPQGLAGLRAVAAVREERAREWNLPRAWLGEDGSLVALAERLQRGETSFPNVRFRHRLRNNAQRDHLAADYADALAEAARLPEGEWPLPMQPDYPSEVRDAADRAHDYLVARGEELHVDPAIFANRAQLLAFVDDPETPENPLAEGWRFEAVGRTVIERFYVP